MGDAVVAGRVLLACNPMLNNMTARYICENEMSLLSLPLSFLVDEGGPNLAVDVN